MSMVAPLRHCNQCKEVGGVASGADASVGLMNVCSVRSNRRNILLLALALELDVIE